MKMKKGANWWKAEGIREEEERKEGERGREEDERKYMKMTKGKERKRRKGIT